MTALVIGVVPGDISALAAYYGTQIVTATHGPPASIVRGVALLLNLYQRRDPAGLCVTIACQLTTRRDNPSYETPTEACEAAMRRLAAARGARLVTVGAAAARERAPDDLLVAAGGQSILTAGLPVVTLAARVAVAALELHHVPEYRAVLARAAAR